MKWEIKYRVIVEAEDIYEAKEKAVEEKKKKTNRYKHCSTVDDILARSGEYSTARLYKSTLNFLIGKIKNKTICRMDIDKLLIGYYKKTFNKTIKDRTAERYASGYISYMVKQGIIKPINKKKYRKTYVLVDKTKKDDKKEIEPELHDEPEIKEMLETAEMQIVKDEKKDVIKDENTNDLYNQAVDWLKDKRKREIHLYIIKNKFSDKSDKEIDDLILALIKNKVLYQQQDNNFIISRVI